MTGHVRVVAVVAAGGALGAAARYAVDVMADHLAWEQSWATLAVNIIGCALMGVLVSYVLAHPSRHPLWRPLLGVGLLGGFTTFSAFAADAVLLADDNRWGASAMYVAATLLGGLIALRVGIAAGHVLRRRRLAT